MSDTQFSSLSPNSSYDFDGGNHQTEEYDFNDQETLSITSENDKNSVGNITNFTSCDNDPFLPEFMKDEQEDIGCNPEKSRLDCISGQISLEESDINFFFNPAMSEDELLDSYLPEPPSCFDVGSSEPFEWEPSPWTTAPLKTITTSNSNKRAFISTGDLEDFKPKVPLKQRKVEISYEPKFGTFPTSQIHISEKFPFKSNGILDRRKTKHHKILSESEIDSHLENKGSINTNLKSVDQNIPTATHPKIMKYPPKEGIRVLQRYTSSIKATYSFSSRKPFSSCNGPMQSERASLNKCHHSSNRFDYCSLNASSRLNHDILEISRIPEPLKMGKKVIRRGQRFSLWQFLMYLLDSTRYKEQSTGIRWVNRTNGVFHIIDSKQVATLWGQYKERRDKMTYDSLARSLRHYYKKNLMAKINNRRLVYQIAQECLQWSSETFIKRSRD